MLALRTTFSWPGWVLFVFFAVGLVTGQDSTPAALAPHAAQTAPSASTGKNTAFDDFVDSALRQERRLTDRMRSFKPIIETYIQEEGSERRFQKGITPNGDDYFRSRLNLAGKSPSIVPFADEETWNQGAEKYFIQDPLPFSQLAFAQALFPDMDHFDRQNYSFEFVRWEFLGEVRCAAVDVKPRGRSKKQRGFVGRIWVEDRDYNIVRFKGNFTSKGLSQRAYHFDSWRLNITGAWWMPAYVYTEESNRPDVSPEESSSQDRSRHRLWFRAQTRVWGYEPKPPEVSRENRTYSGDETIDPPEDTVVERAQVAGLMAADGDVDRILETVVNNLLVTNDLDIAGIRCRVLLTAPLESFEVGRTIVVSRGLLDVLPDEATLAAVLAHELAHIVLGHVADEPYLTSIAWPFPDS